MQTTAFAQDTNEAQQPDAEYVAAAPPAAAYVPEPRIEADGVDWCAWWAEYAERLD